MADEQVQEENAADRAVGEDAASWRSWGNLWQIPTIVLSTVLIIAGLNFGRGQTSKNDFDGAMDQVEVLIESQRFTLARQQLQDVIEPYLDEASQAQQARFHAIVADWIYFAQTDQRQLLRENNDRINGQYARAVELGLTMSPARIERWAETLIMLGNLDHARDRLAYLDAMAIASDGSEDIRIRRNRVFRLLIEHSLATPGISEDEMLEMLADYQKDERLQLADQAWAIAQKAAMRLEAGRTRLAVDHLIVDMRRLELQSGTSGSVEFGPLYTLLGRGYYDLGEYEIADTQLTYALRLLGAQEPAQGDALVLLGKLAFINDDYETAYENYDRVEREFVGTRSYLLGLLGRAEVRSVLGDHDGSKEDYLRLRNQLALVPPRNDINAERISESLRDRHDAALASRRLGLALSYMQVAEKFFKPHNMPSSIQVRIASTSRALGEQDLESLRSQVVRDEAIDPDLRRGTNTHFKRAGDYYIRFARQMAMRPENDEEWAEALWQGADAYDLGGWHDLAIQHFNEYTGARPTDDPRMPEVLYRMAQSYHAQLEFKVAGETYEQVIANHPRSRFASSSYVPLSRCLVQLERFSEAEEHLIQVISGQRFLDPEAQDFRNALMELGSLYHTTEEFPKAIDRLSEALTRYPGDPRENEILFLLGDSYRGQAMNMSNLLKAQTRIAPSERNRLENNRRIFFQDAVDLFTQICDTFEQVDMLKLHPFEQGILRQAYFYRADCAFFLEDYERAIRLYDYAARRYSTHHSSMYALIQIVNSYDQLGSVEQAQVAHRRALVRLEQLPPATFDSPESLMDRQAWERWLENSPVAVGKTASALPVQ